MTNDLGKNYIFAIAIEQYASSEIPPVVGSVAEVKRLVCYLTDHFTFTPENVVELYDEMATEEAIDNGFLHLQDQLSERDSLLIIYSGHSFHREITDESYWVTYDGSLDSVSNNISSTNLASIYLRGFQAGDICLMANAISTPRVVDLLRSFESTGLNTFQMISTGFSLEGSGLGQPLHFVDPIIDFLQQEAGKPLSIRTLMARALDYLKVHFTELEPVYFELNETDWVLERVTDEDHAWEELQRLPTMSGINAYLNQYEGGKYSSEAYQLKATHLSGRAWEDAREEDTIRAYKNFILLHKTSAFTQEAHVRIEQLREEAKLSTKGSRSTPMDNLAPRKPSSPSLPAQKKPPAESASPPRRQITVIPRASAKAPEQDPRSRITISRGRKEPISGTDLEVGSLLCQLPDRMMLGKDYKCEIRIAPADLKRSLLERGLEDEQLEKDTISISKVMLVELREMGNGDNFRIVPESTVEQLIVTDDYTFWRYRVCPMRLGSHELLIKVTAKISTEEFGETAREILVHDKLVEVLNTQQEDEAFFDIVRSNSAGGPSIDLQELRKEVARGNVKKVIDVLTDFLHSFDLRLHSQILTAAHNYSKAERNHGLNLIDYEVFSRYESRTAEALNQLISQIRVRTKSVHVGGILESGESHVLSQLVESLSSLPGGSSDSPITSLS